MCINYVLGVSLLTMRPAPSTDDKRLRISTAQIPGINQCIHVLWNFRRNIAIKTNIPTYIPITQLSAEPVDAVRNPVR